MRNLSHSATKINWGTTPAGDSYNRAYNAVKFVPGMSMVIAGCTDDIPAKCFNFKTGGTLQEFTNLQRSCYSIDVSRDGSQVALGDYYGNLLVENLIYSSF